MLRANTLPAAATWLLALSFFLATSESPANTVVLLAHAQEQPTDCENISPTYCAVEEHIRQRCPVLCKTHRYVAAGSGGGGGAGGGSSGGRAINTLVYYRSTPLDTVAGKADVSGVLERWLNGGASGPVVVNAPRTAEAARNILEGLRNKTSSASAEGTKPLSHRHFVFVDSERAERGCATPTRCPRSLARSLALS